MLGPKIVAEHARVICEVGKVHDRNLPEVLS